MLRAFVVLLTLVWAAPASAQVLEDWRLTGTGRAHYVLTVDSSEAAQGDQSLLLQGDPLLPDSVWAGSEGAIDIRPLQGGHLRVTAYLRTGGAGRAALWARVHGADDEGRFVRWGLDTMQGRHLEGSTPWTHYTLVLPAPEGASMLILGTVLYGGGRVWVDQIELEAVDEAVPVTNPSEVRIFDLPYREPPYLQGPRTKVDFEER